MPKLQCPVSQEFLKLEPALQKAALEKDPTKKPPKLNSLIPTAILNYVESIGVEVDPKWREEANEALTRKPGPQKKKIVESHNLFDERPGTWLSNVAIATGCALVTCGDKSLSLAGCCVSTTAAGRAIEQGWGAIPEAKQTQNDPEHPGLPGIRFIPPGVDLTPKTSPAPPPIALADVGAWISEASILQRDQVVLSDCRVIEQDAKAAIPSDAIRIHKAIASSDKPEQKTLAVLTSIASAQAMAYQLGWTMRKETRSGRAGILLISPRIKLTYEIVPGRTVPVSQ
jgi:hypothetical protein